MKNSIFSSMARYAQQSQRGRRASNSAAKDSRQSRRRTLHLERLEDRVTPATITVTNNLDSTLVGDGVSLREAIQSINAGANINADVTATGTYGTSDTINFNIPGSGVHTISVTSALDAITKPVVIDGYSQQGTSVNTLATSDNAVLLIELDGTLAGSVNGLTLKAGSSTVQGLVINRFGGLGIWLDSPGSNLVQGNFIGTDAMGEAALGNAGAGVALNGTNNQIGGAAPAYRNVISGNAASGDFGVYVTGGAVGTNVEGNFIGTDASGQKALPNWEGIRVDNADQTVIQGNVIAGNTSTGANIQTANTVTVKGNYIGTNTLGTQSLPNSIGIGGNGGDVVGNLISGNTHVGVYDSFGTVRGNLIGTDITGMLSLGNETGVAISDATVGGTTVADRNVISGNATGIFVSNGGGLIQGNYIGTDITGMNILANQAVGIFLFGNVNGVAIGGTTAAARNVIAGMASWEILIQGTTNSTIQGNYIGVDVTGNNRLLGPPPAQGAILVGGSDCSNITIGGTAPGAGNVIGSQQTEVAISNSSNHDIIVQGNSIGVGADGVTNIGGNTGVWLDHGTYNNTIGGTAAGAGNQIANNSGYGVFVASGNGNAILGNSIHDNGGLGINLVNGGNNNQAAPVLTAASSSGAGTTISGTLTSVANTTFRVEFFSNQSLDPSGYGEGQSYLGFATVTTDGSGNASFTAALSGHVPLGQRYLSATATNLSANDTSAFAKDLFVPFNFSGFLPPLNQNLAFGLNRTIPIKFQLTDLDGSVITSLSAVTSLKVAPVLSGGGLGTPFDPTSSGGTGLQNDGTQYIFNWQTKGLAAGSYEILLTLSDGSVRTKVVQLSANGKAGALLIDGSTATTAVGSLLGGNIELYVDNTNGDLTADELARIQDAVTAVDAVTEPYGVAVTEVTDPTLADVTLNMDTTSAVGGSADGVLGCTTDAGQITVINGWNFYAGSDGSQIGSGQYDFETVVTHELGHALGLGHSTDSTSVMYPTLNAGSVNRTLTTADLNVADTDTRGACGLHAGVDGGRVSNPFYETGFLASDEKPGLQGRNRVEDDMVFALLGAEQLPLGSRQFPRRSGEPSRTASVMPVDAVFVPMSERPIFAAALERDTDDLLFAVPDFPSPDGSDAVDFVAADSIRLAD
jgi:hypothetical protein